MTPDHNDLWFVPLGGCGEIGMNMNLYGHDGCWLMVDCGVTFSDPADVHETGGRQIQMADPEFIREHKDKLVGIIITHAHEDHLGALPWLWRDLPAPLFTTAYTAEALRRKFAEHGLDAQGFLRIVEPGDRLQIGEFVVEWIAQTHSIPEPQGLVIETPVGSVFHTADWKLDRDPVVGETYNPSTYSQLAARNITAMVCDSTCATVPGWTASEQSLYSDLHTLISEAKGRVVVACFGSNIARLTTLANIAEATGRHLGILGRSLINSVSIARSTGYWTYPQTLVDREHLGFLPAHTLLLVATGSQGEPRTALHRLSQQSFPELGLEPGDTVIFSARKIPGNEKDIDAMIERLQNMNVRVITPETSDLHIHTSGHPAQDELRQMYEWVSPEVCIPVHGEDVHLDAHVNIAREAGVKRKLRGTNGDLFFLAPNKGIRRNAVTCGRLAVEKRKLVRVD